MLRMFYLDPNCADVAAARGVCRNFEKEFPLHLSDCYIRVVYIT